MDNEIMANSVQFIFASSNCVEVPSSLSVWQGELNLSRKRKICDLEVRFYFLVSNSVFAVFLWGYVRQVKAGVRSQNERHGIRFAEVFR